MNPGIWITIYMPIFIVVFVIIPQQRNMQILLNKNKKRRKMVIMTNEMIKKYIGLTCKISTGFGSSVLGKIMDVNENWIEVETKKGMELINAEFVQIIKVVNV